MNATNKEKSSKKAPRKKKDVLSVSSPEPHPASAEFIIPEELLKNIDEKLSETIKQELKAEKKKAIEDYTPLERFTSEYLKSFLILGFGLNGDKVFIGHAKTAEQHDSLVEHLRRTFSNIMQNVEQ